GGMPVPGRHDRRRQSRRGAAVHRARRPRAPATLIEHLRENARPRQRVRPKAGPMINSGGGGDRFSVRKCDHAGMLEYDPETITLRQQRDAESMRAIKTESAA